MERAQPDCLRLGRHPVAGLGSGIRSAEWTAIAIVAVRRRRRDLALADRQATIHFLPHDIGRIDVARMTTDMGPCLVTTPELTVLDLAHLPKLGDMEYDVWNAIDTFLPRCDNDVLDRRAAEQRLNLAHRRLRTGARERAIA